jgi:hypothetical protein
MRTQGFGMMAELVRDIFDQNIECAGVQFPGKSNIAAETAFAPPPEIMIASLLT